MKVMLNKPLIRKASEADHIQCTVVREEQGVDSIDYWRKPLMLKKNNNCFLCFFWKGKEKGRMRVHHINNVNRVLDVLAQSYNVSHAMCVQI